MALIRSWVNRYTVGAGANDFGRELAGVRMPGVSSVPYQRNLVEIDAELDHGASRVTDRTTIGCTGTS
ncbi:MAG: hypothetical protein CM15mP89_2000 [Gammaproteobacteria bacterium]|nr:MAG: hypothetical protein CM15mP89_2000 [Gammaproteobacteria bacterium]